MRWITVPPPSPACNRTDRRALFIARSLAVPVLTLGGIASSACNGQMVGPLGTGTTGEEQPACYVEGGCNGVNVYCWNEDAVVGDGADETGAGGDADDGNVWYVYPVSTADCDALGGQYTNVEGFNACALTRTPGIGSEGAIAMCVGQGYPAALPNGLDVLDDDPTGWNDDGYPAIEAQIRTQCTAQCYMNQYDKNAGPQAVCEDANWSAVKTFSTWNPGKGYDCQVTGHPYGLDPDGTDVPWELVGGSSSPVPLDCSLDGSFAPACTDWFYPQVGAWVTTPSSADVIEPETRTAAYLGIEGSGSQLELDMFGSGNGVDDTEPVYGMAEYTAIDCGDDACPFFLANMTAYNTTDTWDVRVATPVGRIKKQISDVQIDLLQSTLGVYNTALDVIAFPPGALRFRAEFTVDSCGNCDHTGDGLHAYLVENDDYVFAAYDDGELTIEHEFAMQTGGTATLTVSVVPDESPPVADHDLAATEFADDPPNGLVLDASHSLSNDPDSDIVIEYWWVDGEAIPHGGVLPYGSHQVSLEARDDRGAVDRTAPQWVYVTDPT